MATTDERDKAARGAEHAPNAPSEQAPRPRRRKRKIALGVVCAVIALAIVGVGIAWLFGIYLGWGLVGIWMAFALDENLRAVLFIIRWKAGKWRSIKTV